MNYDEAMTALRDGQCVQRPFPEAPVFKLFKGAVLMYGGGAFDQGEMKWRPHWDLDSSLYCELPRYHDYSVVEDPGPNAGFVAPSDPPPFVVFEGDDAWGDDA